MKNIIKEILISQLSFPLEYKNEKEIWWKNKYGHPATIEIIDTKNEQYIVRGYCDGRLWYKENYCQGQKHGEYLVWWGNGQLWYKENYHQGELHGELFKWHGDGRLYSKAKYNYGKLINEEHY